MFKKSKPRKTPYSEIANIMASVPESVNFLMSLRSSSNGEEEVDVAGGLISVSKSHKECKRKACLSEDLARKLWEERNSILRETAKQQEELTDLVESEEELRGTLVNVRREGSMLKDSRATKEARLKSAKEKLSAANQEKRQLDTEIFNAKKELRALQALIAANATESGTGGAFTPRSATSAYSEWNAPSVLIFKDKGKKTQSSQEGRRGGGGLETMKHPGTYRCILDGTKAWSCCLSTDKNFPGCIEETSISAKSTLLLMHPNSYHPYKASSPSRSAAEKVITIKHIRPMSSPIYTVKDRSSVGLLGIRSASSQIIHSQLSSSYLQSSFRPSSLSFESSPSKGISFHLPAGGGNSGTFGPHSTASFRPQSATGNHGNGKGKGVLKQPPSSSPSSGGGGGAFPAVKAAPHYHHHHEGSPSHSAHNGHHKGRGQSLSPSGGAAYHGSSSSHLQFPPRAAHAVLESSEHSPPPPSGTMKNNKSGTMKINSGSHRRHHHSPVHHGDGDNDTDNDDDDDNYNGEDNNVHGAAGEPQQQDSWAKFDESDSYGDGAADPARLADPSTALNQRAINDVFRKKKSAGSFCTAAAPTVIDGPSLIQIGRTLYSGPKIGASREDHQGLNLKKRPGNRPLTAKAGPHLFSTSTVSPNTSMENVMRRIV